MCDMPDCKQSFAQKNEQRRHMKANHGPKSFVCGGVLPDGQPWGCGKAFGRKDGLLEHQRKTVKCRQCVAQRDSAELSSDTAVR